MKQSFLIILSSLLSLGIKAQHKTCINLQNIDAEDSSSLTLYAPIMGYYNAITPTMTQNFFQGNSCISWNLDTAGIIKIKSKNLNLSLFLEPGDSIIVLNKEGSIKIEGKNSPGQYYINSFPSGKMIDVDIDNSISKATSIKSAMDRIILTMNKYKQKYDSLFDKEILSKKQYEYSILRVESFVSLIVSLTINSKFMAGYPAERQVNYALSNEELLHLQEELYARFDPYNPKYKALAGNGLLINYKTKLKEKLGEKPQSDYVDLYTKIDSSLIGVIYAPREIQDYLAAKSMLTYIYIGNKRFEDLIECYERFKSYFPSSKWNPVLEQQLTNYNRYLKTQSYDASITRFLLELGEGNSITIKKDLDLDVDNINELVKIVSGGSPVLVDCWATWCSPCVAQFKYVKGLHEFTKKSGIKILFLSMDAPASTKYIPFIQNYNLIGTHFISTNKINISLQSHFKDIMTIPKYLLFDADGNLLEKQLNLPETGQKMYDQISNILKL